MTVVCTIGYEGTTVREFLDALRLDGIELLVDIRAVANSRRPGFSKTRLSAGLAEVGIDYLHLRGLGTPSDGRAAARAGRHCHRLLVSDALAQRSSVEIRHLAALREED